MHGVTDTIARAIRSTADQAGGAVKDIIQEEAGKAADWAADELLPIAMDKAIPAALEYVDKNRVAIFQKAKPVLERVGQDDRVRNILRPIGQRVVDRERTKFGKETFYPKYGKWAAPALGVGAGLLAGGLLTGIWSAKVAGESQSKTAMALFATSYTTEIVGIGLVLTGLLLTAGNKAFPRS